ncbi:PREDICTED: uncharacterized protein LOC101306432 isoform X2 [Fragaria vesca subsp. vesca]|uniref:uncharacterized protein LOC101306432 isoform X2 n=1 Tax=Fragaria vesca subsp. vesca TaxID=101020 RepID=UPI0002C2DE89|nr:PREDICTED: uncharacterized protein LOC101306432 isoform X2 [Fragaria vesca subsp. vesca]
MSSRSKGPRNRELKLIQKRDKPGGCKVRKSKSSPAGPSPGAVTSSRFPSADGDHSTDGDKAKELRLAKMCVIRDWCKDSCIYYNPMELRIAEGAELVKPKKTPTCPHQGNKNGFSFIYCKPECAGSVTDPVLLGCGFDRCNIKDNSSDPGSDEEQKGTKHLEMTVDPSDTVCVSSIPLERHLLDPPGWIW